MMTIMFILQLIALFFGITCLTLTIFTYWKERDKLLLYISIFMAAPLVSLINEAVINYIYINVGDLYFKLIPQLTISSLFTHYLIIGSITVFVNFIIFNKRILLANTISIIFFIIIAVIEYFSWDFLLENGEFNYRNYTNLIWTDYLHLLPYFYLCSLFFIRKRVKFDAKGGWLSKKLPLLFFISMPFLAHDLLKFFFYDISYSTLIYMAVSIVFIKFIIRFYYQKKVLKKDPLLSKREMDIVNLVVKGKSNKSIGEELHISLSTVKNHLYNIFKKMEVNNRYELMERMKD